MRDEFGIACCDYCGIDQGEFDEASGNHPICNKLMETMLELEESSYGLKLANTRIEELQAPLKPFADIYEKLMRGDESVTLGNGDIYKQAYLALNEPRRGSGEGNIT